MNIKKYKYLFATLLVGFVSSCVDDIDLSGPKQEEDPDLSGVPSEITDGYSVSFRMSIAPMDGGAIGLNSRATSNQDLRTIENFVDLEKLRILFFTCLDNADYVDAYGKEIGVYSNERKYQTGIHDVFLFEAKSRWVSLVSASEATDASYQVTTPVFSVGEEDDYDWEGIREVLLNRPFKIVILVNRPEDIRYSDFDNNPNFQETEFRFGNKGPYWSKKESDATIELYRYLAKNVGFVNIDPNVWEEKLNEFADPYYPIPSINDLHHCMWDPVYANKNSEKDYHWYDFIIGKPSQGVTAAWKNVDDWITGGRQDSMGAVSAWTTWLHLNEWKAAFPGDTTFDGAEYNHADGRGYISNPNDKNKPMNFYLLPNPEQGIPMYGVQKFQALGDWEEGTPIHLSAVKAGESTNTKKSTITLLRSLARVELIIPKKMSGKTITVTAPAFMSSNVFGRCEPMDVATPTDEIWSNDHSDPNCEWFNIYRYGPIVNKKESGQTEDNFLKRMAWFYGAWKPWWSFEDKFNTDTKMEWFDNAAKTKVSGGMPYPRIYNSCIQRNGTARLDFVQTSDDQDDYYHYVVYTGERNINDPSKFNNKDTNDGNKLKGLWAEKSELAYFKLNINGSPYVIFINPYNDGAKAKNYLSSTADIGKFKEEMAYIDKDNSTTQNEWNYPIMRNHAYVFRVTQLNSSTTDTDGINVVVISSENRTAPTIDFY